MEMSDPSTDGPIERGAEQVLKIQAVQAKHMIKRYTDHAANERTYLAWIRTSIAVMALGFLVEKFNLFLWYISTAIVGPRTFYTSKSAEFVGLTLLVLGMAIVLGSTIRFFLYKRAIEAELPEGYGRALLDYLLGALIVLIGIFLVVFMSHQVIG